MSSELLEQWKTPEIEEAIQELKKLNQDERWKTSYLEREKALRDYVSIMQEKFEDGLQKGREEGREEGLQKGREEERRLLAQRLLDKGMSITEVADTLDISEQQVSLWKT